MKTTMLITLTLVLTYTFTASGQDRDSVSTLSIDKLLDYAQDTTFASRTVEFEGKNPKKARRIAILNTIIPSTVGSAIVFASLGDDFSADNAGIYFGAALMAYGGLIGPSMGNLYAKDYARGFGGIGFRAAAFFAPYILLDHHQMNEFTGSTGDSILLMLFGASAWYNILSAKKSARIYNRKNRLQLSPSIDMPTKTPTLSVRVNF